MCSLAEQVRRLETKVEREKIVSTEQAHIQHFDAEYLAFSVQVKHHARAKLVTCCHRSGHQTDVHGVNHTMPVGQAMAWLTRPRPDRSVMGRS